MKAMEKTGKALREITVKTSCSFGGEPNRLPASVFDQSLGLTNITSTAFQNLTKLRLTLELKTPHNRHNPPWDQDGFHQVLSAATNVRYMHIGLGSDEEKVAHGDGTNFEVLFKNISFPKLEILSLNNLSSTAEELLDFLQASHAVRCLILVRFLLRSSFWIPMVQTLRDTTQVNKLQLDKIDGFLAHENITRDLIDVGILQLAPRMLEFFQRDKGSVVSPEEIQKVRDMHALQMDVEANTSHEALNDGSDYNSDDSDEWVDVESSDEEPEVD